MIRFFLLKTALLLVLHAAVINTAMAGTNRSDNGDGTFTNPVIAADFPDIDVLQVGDTYYMLSTTMFVFPGVTLLKSKDLVNWEYACNPLPRMDVHPAYNLEGGDRYAHGQWAGSLKYHDGTFYILFNTQNDGGYILTAGKPEGPWKLTKLKRGFHDPGLFFDEDGKIYVAHGYGKISITPLNADFSPAGKDSLVFTGTIRGGIEGSHVYKINGYYYLYCTYGGADGLQVALRSKTIYGPYEQKIVLWDKTKSVNFGVHQGALFQIPSGEWWTMLFIDAGPLGRMPSLQPVHWEDGWPVAGENGAGVVTYRKPNVGKTYPVLDLPDSDEFDKPALGMQWGWNHNPDSLNWSLSERKGWLTLRTGRLATGLKNARNTLTQRIFMNYDQTAPTAGIVKMDVSRMKDGDEAGLAVFQDPYAYIAVSKDAGRYQLVMVNNGIRTDSVPYTGKLIYFRALACNATRKASFQYSVDNKVFKPLGTELPMRFSLSIFTGNKFCLFNFARKQSGGWVDVDWFRTDEGRK